MIGHPLPPTIHESGMVTVNAGDTGALSYSDPLAILGTAPFPDEPWWQRLSPSTIFVLLASAMAVFFIAHELINADTSIVGDALGFPADQAWTQQVYARNFFHHIDFEFNAGERTASPAAPFWVVFLSISIGLFHDPLLAAKLLGAIFLFLTGYYSFRVLKSVGIEHGAALLGGALVMTSSALAWAELSGLETCLAAALIVGALWWLVSGEAKRWTHPAITGAIFALAALTRPEAALVFVVILIHSFFVRPHAIRNAAIMLALFVLIIAPIGITNFAIGGSALPPAFSASLANSSALRLLAHGNLSDLAGRCVLSLGGIWFAILDLYLRENPVWIFTIVIALFSRWRRPLIRRDALDSLFSISALIVLLFPYLRALVTGSNDGFGNHEPGATFILPIYEIAGVLSLASIARRELFRNITPRKSFEFFPWMILLTGLAVGRAFLEWNILYPGVLTGLLMIFSFLAYRHAGMRIFKPEMPHEVQEAERNEMTFHRDDAGLDSNLSEPAIKTLRGMLLMALAWNLAVLPGTAHIFANEVRSENTRDVRMARVIASKTQPTDMIATNAPGAIGYFSERRVLDLSGSVMRIDRRSAPHLAWFGNTYVDSANAILQPEFVLDSQAVLYHSTARP